MSPGVGDLAFKLTADLEVMIELRDPENRPRLYLCRRIGESEGSISLVTTDVLRQKAVKLGGCSQQLLISAVRRQAAEQRKKPPVENLCSQGGFQNCSRWI